MQKPSRSFSVLALIMALVISLLPAQAQRAYAASADVVISQVYGGGGNSGATLKNDFVELFNRGATAVDISSWSVQYASSSGSTWQVTKLTGTIQPGQYYLVQEGAGSGGTQDLPTPDAVGTILMSATSGKVALANNQTVLSGTCPSTVDFVGFGTANCFEGTAAVSGLSNSMAGFRANGGCVDTDDNAADFSTAAPSPRNSASPLHQCSAPINPSGTGSADPNFLFAGDPTLLTVAVTPGANPTSTGLNVSCDLSAIGGSSSQSFYDDGSNGDTTAADSVFSFAAVIDSSTTPGAKDLACDVTDAQSRTDSVSIPLTITVIQPIGQVNGAVLDGDNGAAHTSPFVGQTVTVQGVVYEKTLQAVNNSSNTYKGFFIQNTPTTADSDPNTSDGLFVFMSSYGDIKKQDGSYYVPQVGDELVISGKISEYYNMTELTSATLMNVVQTGVDLSTAVVPEEANPPVSLADANRYWERLQGMRISVPADSIVLGGRNVFSPADAEIWVARPDSTIAQRSDPYAQRAFRDAHPLDDNYDPATWDGNGYRILLGSLGIKAAVGDAQALIDPARTFDTLINPVVGGLNYTFNKYRVEIDDQPVFNLGPDPSQNNPPQVLDPSVHYTIADYNLENLYDFRDNPASGCDFTGDSGCPKVNPFLSAVTPPYDYVPANDAAYQARLTDIATQITNDLHSPDILMVQEVENQDICVVSAGALNCGITDNADGKPDVLQELALRIAEQGGPAYDAAFDRDSSDLRGIAPAFLYRTDRVELLPAAGDPILGTSPAIAGFTPVPYDGDVSNPKTLNAELPAGVSACETSWVFPRAPDIGLFRIYRDSVGAGSYRDVYVINNHFKSGPDSCVAHRTMQANYNAALVDFIQTAKPDARIVLGGDLNVYPRPDDPFAPLSDPASSDQLGALYNPSLGLTNLWSVLLGQAPEAAYSYVYLGQAQTLDQMYINQPMLADLDQYRVAHINSDFPADYPGDVARGTSDHDPNVASFYLPYDWTGFKPPLVNAPAINNAKAGSTLPLKFSLGGDMGLDVIAEGFPVSQQIDGTTFAPIGGTTQTTAVGHGLTYDPIANQYIYNWKTDKSWAGTYRQLILKLKDGTTHIVYVKFK